MRKPLDATKQIARDGVTGVVENTAGIQPGAVSEGENGVQPERRLPAVSVELQRHSGRDTATANRTAMVITGSGSGTPETLLQ